MPGQTMSTVELITANGCTVTLILHAIRLHLQMPCLTLSNDLFPVSVPYCGPHTPVQSVRMKDIYQDNHSTIQSLEI